MKIYLPESAAADLIQGYRFYEKQAEGWANILLIHYFLI